MRTSSDAQRRAERVAEFRECWSSRPRRRREQFEDLPKPTDEPVVSPNVTNKFQLSHFNKKDMVKAELDARNISYDPAAPLRKRSTKRPDVPSLLELLTPFAEEHPETKSCTSYDSPFPKTKSQVIQQKLSCAR
mmetsp:Transcript_9237/g.30009  ORF Transcript_9237/g.30009 Transcript_9237/m.30009 type:complete len:134 (+) Transcript_9237:1029-1430(+)